MSKRLRVVFIVLAVTIIGLSAARAELVPYNPATMSFPVSVQQAEDSARAWAGNSGLAFTVDYVSFSAMDPSEPPFYVLKTTDGSEEFQVNCLTGEMVLWIDNIARQARCDKTWPTYDDSNKLSLATLHANVTQFLAAKYANFSNMNMQSGNPDESSCYYYQTLANGACYMSSFALCVIDEWSGQVYKYFGEHGPPITISIQPDVSQIQAQDIALDYGGLIPLHIDGSIVYAQSAFILKDFGLGVRTDDFGGQRLFWSMRIVIHEQAGYTAESYNYELQNRSAGATGEVILIAVDAHTGEVFYSEPDGPMGGGAEKLDRTAIAKMKSRKPNTTKLKSQPMFKKGQLEIDNTSCSSLLYPPLEVGGTGYLHIRYIPMLYGGTIKVSSGSIELRIADKLTVLRAGSNVIKSRQHCN